ncbi:MAG: cadmium resistance transporter [Myxococcota bacterium]|nr:cadmium resistance transporter [Myxococcota bacterium]
MPEILQIVPPAAGAYLATNMDNLVVLAAMLADHAHDRKRVLAGFVISVLSTLGISFLVALFADVVPTRYLGLLGVIPLAMGALGLPQARHARTQPSDMVRKAVGAVTDARDRVDADR